MTGASLEIIWKYFIEIKCLIAFNTSRLMLLCFVLLLNIKFSFFYSLIKYGL